MSKSHKIITLVIIVAILSAITYVFMVLFHLPRLTYERAECIFVEEYEHLIVVVDFFEKFEYGDVIIHSDFNRNAIFMGKEGITVSEEFILAVEILFQKGFRSIAKSENTVYFIRWNAFAEASRGIAFTFDGKSPNIPYLTYYRALPITNWWYYEESLDLWRRENK